MKNKKVILALMIILVIVAIAILVIINNIKKQPTTDNTTPSNEVHMKTDEQINSEDIEKLKSMSEKERIRFYVSKYISYIETNEYEKAYALLYDDFKANYFPTVQDFKNYVKNKYPDIITMNNSSIKREGKYYILTMTFADMIEDKKNFAQKFIVVENNYNDFVLSFQAE